MLDKSTGIQNDWHHVECSFNVWYQIKDSAQLKYLIFNIGIGSDTLVAVAVFVQFQWFSFKWPQKAYKTIALEASDIMLRSRPGS